MRVIILILAGILSLSSPALAQQGQDRPLPTQSNIVSIKIPTRFHYADGKLVFVGAVREYVPNGQTKDKWKSRLLLKTLGPGAPLKGKALENFGRLYLVHFHDLCFNLTIDLAGKNQTPSTTSVDYRVYCETTSQARLDHDDLRPIEISLYRFIVSRSAVYEASYAWHGGGDEASAKYAANPEAFWRTSSQMLDNIHVCDVARATNCPIDYDSLGGTDVVPATGKSLRCRADKTVRCLPAAILSLTPSVWAQVDTSKKKGLAFLQMNKMNLHSTKSVLQQLILARQTLFGGSPEMVLVMKPTEDPNHIVTADERAAAVTYLTAIGELATQNDIASSYDLKFVNFQ